jgi:hypothetical protein
LAARHLDDPPPLRVRVLVEALELRGVEYLVVGGVAANSYGANRTTEDMDCLVRRERANLDRLGEAMRDLGARLRVEGLTDEQAKALPFPVDGDSLARQEISTWTTDAGWFDVLTNIPARDGKRMSYEDLEPRATVIDAGGFTIRAAGLQDIVDSKEWADRPKDHEALGELHEILSTHSSRASVPAPAEPAPSIGGLVEACHPIADTPPGAPGPQDVPLPQAEGAPERGTETGFG